MFVSRISHKFTVAEWKFYSFVRRFSLNPQTPLDTVWPARRLFEGPAKYFRNNGLSNRVSGSTTVQTTLYHFFPFVLSKKYTVLSLYRTRLFRGFPLSFVEFFFRVPLHREPVLLNSFGLRACYSLFTNVPFYHRILIIEKRGIFAAHQGPKLYWVCVESLNVSGPYEWKHFRHLINTDSSVNWIRIV